jgi:CDP-glucose 4,6-dehydratase
MPKDQKNAFWHNKRIFLTGHTGFKGGWLALWLASMGAKVYGYALAPTTEPAFFHLTGLSRHVEKSTLADIRDTSALNKAMADAKPEVVFHLAAQPLVRQGYLAPLETCEVNILGTAYLMEAIRSTGSVKALVNVTTDKCYENREWPWPYRENEALGGHDPYSASKACAEILTAAWRSSFLAGSGTSTATARAGNVIGGGDWAEDRLVPDILRAMDAGKPLMIRSPQAIRPWQHVLEPLSGYLLLAERLCKQQNAFDRAWNFGPWDEDAKTVEWMVEHIRSRFPELIWQKDAQHGPHEATFLRLDSSLARTGLGWHPRWNLAQALDQTLAWHGAWKNGENMGRVSLDQIAIYEKVKAP